MINFTVGPVSSDNYICDIGAEQVPYFRTAEFSEIMLENEQLIKKMAGTPKDGRAVFLTGSGTAAMEAAVINLLSPEDRVLVINGGTFGRRFVDLCSMYSIDYTEVSLAVGKTLSREQLWSYAGNGYTALLVNVHETSTGVLYDMDMIGEFCRQENIFLVADAISAFIADELSMEKMGINAMILSSQKALACPPGISTVVLDGKALERVEAIEAKTMYLNIKDALKNQERGQTPFTPAVGILRQINARLKQIDADGGIDQEREKIFALAQNFREGIEGLGFEMLSEKMSNAATALKVSSHNAKMIVEILKDEFGIWVCPNGGDMADDVFRVGHIGALTIEDNNMLINAFRELKNRGII